MEQAIYRVSISRWITEGWNTFLRDVGTFALVGICSTIIVTVLPLLWGPVLAAMVCFSLRFLEGNGATITDYFEGYRSFIPALLCSLIIMLLTLVGLIFLIVPGLVIFSMYLLSFAFVGGSGVDFWQAMQESRRVTSRDYFGFTLFMLALFGLNLLGFFFFYVGLVFTLPVSACAIALAYRDAVGIPATAVTRAPSGPIIIP